MRQARPAWMTQMRRAGWPVLAVRSVVAGVWIASGLVAKVLGLVPRHEAIVAAVLGPRSAPLATVLIGIAEVGLAIWLLSGVWPRMCAAVQTAAIVAMNALELTYTRHLLLAPLPMLVANGALLAAVWWAALRSHRSSHEAGPDRASA